MRRLIINADDFGLTAGVNRAVIEAHLQGVVTSATLMANGSAFTDALRLAGGAPKLSVGCHVVLADGSPLMPASLIPSLLAKQANKLSFYPNMGRFAWRALSNQFDSNQLEAEITAQIRKLQSAGVAVSHVDTHKHTHVLPQILKALLRAAQACGVRALRNPFELLQIRQLRGHAPVWRRWLQVRALHPFSRSFRNNVHKAGMAAPDGTIGIAATGALDERLFQSLVQNLSPGTWELVCHPGYCDAELDRVRTRLRESRAQELRLLTSAEARDLLERGGIELISYRQL